MLNKDFVTLWSAVLNTYLEDAEDMNIDFVEIYRHASSDYTREIFEQLGLDRITFLKAMKAIRKQARFEFVQQDNIIFKKEQARQFKSAI